MNRTALIAIVACASASAQVRFEDILKSPAEGWLTYSGSYSGWRYAPGRQITPQNAGSLVPKSGVPPSPTQTTSIVGSRASNWSRTACGIFSSKRKRISGKA